MAAISQYQDIEIPGTAKAGADLRELYGAGLAADEHVGFQMVSEVGTKPVESMRCHGDASRVRKAMATLGSSRSCGGIESATESGSAMDETGLWRRTG